MSIIPIPDYKTHTLQRLFKPKYHPKCKEFCDTFSFAYYFGVPCFVMSCAQTHYYIKSHELYEEAYNYMKVNCSDVVEEIPIDKDAINNFTVDCYAFSDERNVFLEYDELDEISQKNFVVFEGTTEYDERYKENKWYVPEVDSISNMEEFVKKLASLPHIVNDYDEPTEKCQECEYSFKPFKDNYYVDSTFDVDNLDIKEYTKRLFWTPHICERCYMNKDEDDKRKYFLPHEDIQKTITINFTHQNMMFIRPELAKEYDENECNGNNCDENKCYEN